MSEYSQSGILISKKLTSFIPILLHTGTREVSCSLLEMLFVIRADYCTTSFSFSIPESVVILT